MREFFRGWKRKTGCVTLLLACAFVAGWVRSFSRSEGFDFYRGKHTAEGYHPEQIFYWTQDSFYSDGSAIHWQQIHEDERNITGLKSSEGPFHVWSHPKTDTSNESYDEEDLKWRWQFCGISAAEVAWSEGGSVRNKSYRWRFLHVPYWSIVVPLILLSAWLLLSKLRAKKPNPDSG